MNTSQTQEGNVFSMSNANRLRLWAAALILFALYVLSRFGVGLYTDWLWFQNLSFEQVFLTTFTTRAYVFLAVAIPFALLFLANTFIARWLSTRNILFFSDEMLVAQRLVRWAIWVLAILLAWLVGIGASTQWLEFLLFINQVPFEINDPIFGRDVAFYVFSLPVIQFIQSWLLILLFLCLFGVIGIYALAQRNNLEEGRIVILPHVQLHLSVLGALIFLDFAWGHRLNMFELLYSPRGVAFGASYTDIHVALPVLRVLMVIAIAAAVTLLVNIYVRRALLPVLAIFVWIIGGFVLNGFLPAIVQRYIVEPNELAREAPYIRNNIDFTRQGFGLDKFDERDFGEIQLLTAEILTANEATLKNVRLWDTRPLLDTYQQIQAIRLYYTFPDVDVDRYWIGDEYRQVMLALRELDKSKLQSPTWVTQKLQFTHGYGAVVNPVNEVTNDGLPRLWTKDLPPETTVGLEISRPQIYYGEQTDDYVFVRTAEPEFDYPSGDENVYSTYEGQGGVKLDTFIKRLAFALRLSDSNILLSGSFRPDSRVMFHRNVRERASTIAPFLFFDRDPYPVISNDGLIYWILDAFTISGRYPYSEPSRENINYIRNPVKVVVDAYNGTLVYYIIDDSDPLIRAYQAIFPSLFQPQEEMPDFIRQHLRYPEDLFSLQADIYRTYHMRDINVFYNKEDLWAIPQELLQGGSQQLVEPYSVIITLPGESEDEFLLIQPFTPTNKDNLIAWIAGRADGEHYGQIVVYQFPKQELIFGPLQIEARIDQNPEISAQISLWSQQGSQVIRGNLLVIPLDDSLLYIEPLYLQAETGKIPELKRVIVASGENVVMANTLAAGLAQLFGNLPALASGETTTTPTETAVEEDSAAEADTPTSSTSASLEEEIAILAQAAADHYEAAQAALGAGDWATYGIELEAMKAELDRMLELTERFRPTAER
jgi:uncharacterized protein